MSVVQPDGWEYDFWNVRSIGSGKIVARRAGRTRIDGDGLGSDAVVADFGNYAGEIREPELAAGRIDHALAMVVPCSDSSVYPAPLEGARGYPCRAGIGASRAIPIGTRFVLDIPESRIGSMAIPDWKKTILIALARYGAYVRDTTGAPDQWGFEFESPAAYVTAGMSDPWLSFARTHGGDGPHDFNGNEEKEWWLYLDDPDGSQSLPWDHLQALAPCSIPGAKIPCSG